jgi:hypothetical protein
MYLLLCLFVVYLTKLLGAQTIQCRLIRLLLNIEFKRSWPNRDYPNIFMYCLKKTRNKVEHDSYYSGRDSNGAPPGQESRALGQSELSRSNNNFALG